jgi:hypothetical protein
MYFEQFSKGFCDGRHPFIVIICMDDCGRIEMRRFRKYGQAKRCLRLREAELTECWIDVGSTFIYHAPTKQLLDAEFYENECPTTIFQKKILKQNFPDWADL